MFQHNFQSEDKTPYFIKYGNIWHFTGFPIEQRENVMKQTWDLIRKNYES